MAQDRKPAETVTAERWDAARAAQLQKRAQAEQARAIGLARGEKARKEASDRIAARETGFGTTPHATPDVRLQAQEQLLRRFMARLREADPEEMSFSDLERELGLAPATRIQATSVSMVLKTDALGPVTSGGFVWTFDPDTRAYLGGSGIGAGGEITIAVEPGTEMDIMAFVFPPFAQQKVESVVSAADLEITLEDAVNVPINIRDQEGTLLNGVTAYMNLRRIDYSQFDWPAGVVSGSGTVPLAPGESYNLTAEAAPPYLSGALAGISSTDPELNVEMEEGTTVTFDFEDPLGLLGEGGCVGSGQLTVYRSSETIKNEYQPITRPTAVFDGPHLDGFVFAVPDAEAVDYELRFDSAAGGCLLQDIDERFAWFFSDQTVPLDLAPRPLPDIQFKTPGGADIPWIDGRAYPADPLARSIYFPAGGYPSLQAGEHYSINLRADGDYTVNEVLIQAEAGPFEVILEAEPLIVLTSMITIDGAYNVTALIEIRRDAELVEAFEFSGSELTIEIPAGTYDIRVSGLTGRWYDSSTNRDYSIYLQPFTVERTFTGASSETLDFDLPRPDTGIHFTLPSEGVDYLFTVLDDSVPVAAQTFYYWHDGILTDFDPIDLVIRGPGYDDTAFSATPTIAIPSVGIAALQDPVGRLSGVLQDSDEQPLPGIPIILYSQNGQFSNLVDTTDSLGAFDVPKIRNGLYLFSAPEAGDSVMHFRDAGDPAADEDVSIMLDELAFHSVSADGPTVQLLYGTGEKGYRIAVLAEGYTSVEESFTDSNANQVWDGALFIDLNQDGVWNQGEPFQTYGERTVDWNAEDGTDITIGNEPFTDLNGDAYPNIDDFSVFVQNAKNYIRSLLGTPEIRDNIDFDVYIVFLPSPQAGLDVYNQAEEQIIDFDTLFGGAYLMNRSLLSINRETTAATLETHVPDRDLQIVMINMPVRAGRANSYILAYGGLGNSSPNNFVAGHEFGHNPGGLLDEYNEFSGTSTSYFRPSIKHLTHRKETPTVPWYDLIGPRDDLPVSVPHSSGIGVFAGGNYNNGGVFRSTTNSRMRNNAPAFNDISLDVFSFSLCLRSLTDADLKVAPADPPPDAPQSLILADGFEDIDPTRGVLDALCQ